MCTKKGVMVKVRKNFNIQPKFSNFFITQSDKKLYFRFSESIKEGDLFKMRQIWEAG